MKIAEKDGKFKIRIKENFGKRVNEIETKLKN